MNTLFQRIKDAIQYMDDGYIENGAWSTTAYMVHEAKAILPHEWERLMNDITEFEQSFKENK